MINRQRFELALERLTASDWARFETLASDFLSPDLPSLRTTASPSGDGGRDASLFSSDGEPGVVVQYSVTKSWKLKIESTVKSVKKNFPAATVLVYVTNQLIGAKADDLCAKVRKTHGLMVDVRDRSWFLERVHLSDQRELAAKNLAAEIVDPYLSGREIIATKAQALSPSYAATGVRRFFWGFLRGFG